MMYLHFFFKKKKENGEGSTSTQVCKDCKEAGHFSKAYYKCRLYKKDSADDGRLYTILII